MKKIKSLSLSTGSIIKDALTENFIFIIETEDFLSAVKEKAFLRFTTAGGKLQFNETPSEAFRRELNEEVGYKKFKLNSSPLKKFPFFKISKEGVKEIGKFGRKYADQVGLRAVFKKEGDFLTDKKCRPSLVFVFGGQIYSPFPKGETGIILELSKETLLASLSCNLTIRDLLSREALVFAQPHLDWKKTKFFLKPVGTAELLAHLLKRKTL